MKDHLNPSTKITTLMMKLLVPIWKGEAPWKAAE